jgi:4-amino-4-deoxy-L-arabinose transferase-like glycosyltransferase
MFLFLLLFILEGILSFLLKDCVANIDILSIVYICINTGAMIFILIKRLKDRDLFYIIMIGYMIRVLLIFYDIFVARIPPHSGGDSELFQGEAIAIAADFQHINEALGGMYAKFLGIFYYIFGPQRIMAQYLNTILGISMILIVISILKDMNGSRKTIKVACVIMTFFPQNIIFSAILLRETLVGMFLLLSLKYFIKWMKRPMVMDIILSVLCLGGGSMFHSAIVPAFLGYIFMYSFYRHSENKLEISFKSLFLLGIFGLISLVIYIRFDKIIFAKFGDVKSIDSLISTVNVNFGGSAYLTGVKLNNFTDILIFTPIKTIYFLFSPMPWDIRGSQDIISILLDSAIYLYIIYSTMRQGSRIMRKNRAIFFALTGIFLLDAVTLGLGTFTAGTAIRHRNKIFPLLIIIYSIALDEYGEGAQINEVKKEEGYYAKGEYNSTNLQC